MKKDNHQRIINILLALLIGFSGWFYVIYTTDPVTNKTIKDVPVEFNNDYVLGAEGLAVKSMDVDTIAVTFEGKRSAVGRIKPGDIRAHVNMADAGKGENVLQISVTAPSNITVKDKSSRDATVVLEDGAYKEVAGYAEYADTVELSAEPYIVSKEYDTYTVYGAASLIDKVDHVRLPLKYDKLESGVAKTFSVKLEAMDSEDKPVRFIEVSPSSESVEAYTASTKSVPLKVNIDLPDNDDYKYTYTAPDHIMIKGSEAALAKVDKIETEAIEPYDIYESTSLALEYILPDGVQIANASVNDELHLKVLPYISKTIEVPASQVKFNNLDSKYKAELSRETISVTVVGLDKDIKDLDAKSLTLSASAGKFEAGTYTIDLKVEADANVHKAYASDGAVYVTVSEK